MDFRTEWTSWVLLILMIAIAVVVNPYHIPAEVEISSISIYVLQILAYPFFAVTVASLPVFIICWILEIIPDIDYSIRGGFLLMLVLLIGKFMTL